MTRCAICYRKANNEYCNFHDVAYKNIIQAFEKWKSSKTISWEEYLNNLKNKSNSGIWVKEICNYLLSKK